MDSGDAPQAGPAVDCRRLIRARDRAVLSTTMRPDSPAAAGAPYGSLVLVACDHAARPLLLISDLAEHTRNLRVEPRCSLLIDDTAGLADPLTGARATLIGTAEPVEDASLAARFVARHPSAGFYAGFRDFHLFRMTVEQAHLVAGFGRIHWVDGGDVILPDPPAALAEQEAGIVEHMNADHSDAVGLYANVLLGRAGVGWRMTGVDPEGADLHRGGETARLCFDKLVGDAEGARVELVRLVKRARSR